MTAIKPLLFIFFLTGLALAGFAFYQLFLSWSFTHAKETTIVPAEFMGYHAEVSQKKSAGGRIENFRWFSQAQFKYNGKLYTDPNFLLFESFNPGEEIQIAYNSKIQAAVLDSFHARYAFYLVVLFIGFMFLGGSWIGSTLLPEIKVNIGALIDTKPAANLPLTFRHAVYAFYALVAFCILMAFKEHIIQLFPSKQKDLALIRAIETGKDEAIQQELDRGPDLEQADMWRKTPLYHAIIKNDYNTTLKLLDRNVSFDCAFESPLLTAIAIKNEQIAKLLIERGHPLNVIHPPENYTPFDIAVLVKLPHLATYLANKNTPHTTPQIFFDVALKGQIAYEEYIASEGPAKVNFGKVGLEEWAKLFTPEK